MQNINQSLRNVIFSPKGKYLLSLGLLFTILLLFYLFQHTHYFRGFDYNSYSRGGYNLLHLFTYRDFFGMHAHFPPLMSSIYAFFLWISHAPDTLIMVWQALIFFAFYYLSGTLYSKNDSSFFSSILILSPLLFSKHFIIVCSSFNSEPLYFTFILLAIRPFSNESKTLVTKDFLYSSFFFTCAFFTKQLVFFHFVLFSLLILARYKRHFLIFMFPMFTGISLWLARNYFAGIAVTGRPLSFDASLSFNYRKILQTLCNIFFDYDHTASDYLLLGTGILALLLLIILLGLIMLKVKQRQCFSLIETWHLLSFFGYIPFVLFSFYFFDPEIKMDERLTFPYIWHYLMSFIFLFQSTSFFKDSFIRRLSFTVFSCFILSRLISGIPSIHGHVSTIANHDYTRAANSALMNEVKKILENSPAPRPVVITNQGDFILSTAPLRSYVLFEHEVTREILDQQCRRDACYRLLFKQDAFNYYYMEESNSLFASLSDSLSIIIDAPEGTFSKFQLTD